MTGLRDDASAQVVGQGDDRGMSVLQIWPEERRREGDKMVVSAVIEAPGEERKRLWYSLPESRATNLPGNSDLFAVGTIFLMMQTGVEVCVHGKVSPSLLRNLAEYQAAWVAWMPTLKSVEIRADQEEETVPSEQREDAVLAFSGGVDSSFTAFRHAGSGASRIQRSATAAVMVHGFDIPLDEPETFDSARKRSEAMTSSVGLDLIPVATNYRLLVEDWNHSFGAALASCLMLFSGRFRAGLIGQGFTYGEFRSLHEGSNPLTDPMLSSDLFRIVPDGAAFDRAEKILAMREWSECLQYLRVCWAGPQKDRNCCVCEKCIRNILTFRALGLGLPPCFDRDVDDEQIKAMNPGHKVLAMIRYSGLGKLAAAHGANGPWVGTLEARLAPLRWSEEARMVRYLKHPRYYAGRAWKRLKSPGG
jgi:hypothetical protein